MIDQFLTRLAATMARLVPAMPAIVAALGFLAYAAYLADLVVGRRSAFVAPPIPL